MNKKHISKVGKYIGMACLLFVCAMAQSCRDEYFFDDTAPDFVGPSIYDYLNEQGDFKCFLQVIDDLDYKEVLQRTGSKTLFVANDQAFMDGIWREWGFSDYGQLTPAHKRVILYGAMLDNAYLLEMLSKMQSMGVNAEPVPGQCLRRVSSSSLTDTVGVFAPVDLPENNPYWEGIESIRLALDASNTMLTHFTEDQLYMKNITEKDLDWLVAGGRGVARLSDYYIYDKRVIKEKSDITCKNGYVHQLEGLLIPPSNMAEELRQNGTHEDLAKLKGLQDGGFVEAYMDSTTLLFSRMLDRFAVPSLVDASSKFAEDFKRIYGTDEPLYEKKYFTEGRFTSYKDADGKVQNALGTLLFDPGWNAYSAGSTAKELDMAAILAPSDKAVISYFTDKAGRSLWERYAPEAKNVVEAIDSIPVDIIQPLVRNHMQMSFNSTVPSKFEYIVDDARDQMKVVVEDVRKVILANNGVVYVMDTLYSPARYNSVIAPVMLTDELSIFNKGINEIAGQYDKYLLSMGNKFGLIVTSDESVVYYNPYTERKYLKEGTLVEVEADESTGGTGRQAFVMEAKVQADGSLLVDAKKVKYDASSYNPETNTYGDLTSVGEEKGNFNSIFKEVLEYNIVVGDMNSKDDCISKRKYYMSKGYGTVKVERKADGTVDRIFGGRELQYKANGIPVVKTHTMTNGQTYVLDGSMIQPPTQTVRDVLYGYDGFKEFRNLCEPSKTVLEFLYPKDKDGKEPKEWNNYQVFYEQMDRHHLVRMFNTYHYTVYVPTNDKMAEAHQRGLLTWEDLENEISAFSSEDPEELEAFKNSIQAGADQIANFVRYHFQDNSVYVDNVAHSLPVDKGDTDGDGVREYDYQYEVSYETSAFNDVRKKFCPVLVKTENNTISVRGDFGDNKDVNVCYVIKDVEHETYNVMARENQYSGGNISTSSYAVVHQIDNFLVFGGEGGIYDPEMVNEETGEKGMFVR